MKLDLNDYYYFVHVVEKQGYTAAAAALQMPKSRLSRHVAQLEARLGVRLLQRTSRHVAVTQEGLHFYGYARKLVDAMELAESAMKNTQGELSGKAVISCSTGVAQYALGELLIEFAERHPQVKIEQRVANSMANLIAEGVDLAIRGHNTDLPNSSLIQRSIARVDWPLFASPALLEKVTSLKDATDLAHLNFLRVGRFNQTNTINLIDNKGQNTSQTVIAKLCSEDMSTLKRAAIAGLGVTSLPNYVCKSELKSGELVRVLPEYLTQAANLSLVMPSRLGVPVHIKALADFIRDKLPSVMNG